jgi:hypothetical protein
MLVSFVLSEDARSFAATTKSGEYADKGTTGSSVRPELLEDSKALATILNECKRHSGSLIGHAVGDLQKRLGKEMMPRETGDITTMLRIADDCATYLSSPELVSGMELPAAQETRREANNTLQRLDEISRRIAGSDLRSLEARTREHLQSTTSPQSVVESVRQTSTSAASTSGTVQPLAVYQRAPNAPELPRRMASGRVEEFIMEASQAAKIDTDHFLTEADSTVSADLLAIQRSTMRYPNFANHPLMQQISTLRKQLGKSLQPANVNDVEVITELLSNTLRIFGDSEFQLAYGHVDRERDEIGRYKARQSAFSSAASTIADIERNLDRGDLIAADKQYQQVAADSFMSQFTTTQRYLAETAGLRKELSAYREATQVPRVRPGQQPLEQVLTLANEVAKLEANSGNSLASDLLRKSVQQDKLVVESRMESLPAFAFNPGLYKVPPITNHNTEQEAATRLDDLNQRLGFANDLTAILSRQDAIGSVRVLFGESTEADLRRKGASIPSAQEVAASLSNAIQGYQRAVQEAETRKRAAIEEQQSLAGKIVNGALIVVMLDEKFERTSIMGYQMEASKQRQELRGLIQRDRKLLTPQVWSAVQSEFQRLIPGLTVYQASATKSLLSNLRGL